MDLFYIGKLRELRKAYGLTQSEVAFKLGISKRHYLRIENGYTLLTVKLLVSLCRLYRVSSDYVLGLNEVSYDSEA